MRAKTVYICDVCNTEYNYQEEAEQCEDQPIIEPEWLKIGFEKGFYGFGETGVKFFEKGTIFEGSVNDEHHRLLYGVYGLSHNQSGDYVHYNVLNPYHGWDFLRYIEYEELDEQIRLWRKACVHYEVEPLLDKCDWVECLSERKLQKITEILANENN